jgi:predicted HicB family RNase H-like nuclease
MSEAEQSRDTETSRAVIVRVPVAVHRALRIRVAEEDTSIQQWILTLIEQQLKAGNEKGKPKK